MRIFKSAVERADDHFSQGRYEKAAEFYLKAKRYEQAAEIFHRQLHDIDRAVGAYDQAGKPLDAGRVLEAAERYREAIKVYQSAGSFRRAAEACVKSGHMLRAASFYEQAEIYDRAADCYLDSGEVEGAVRVLEKEAAALEKRADERGDPILDQRLRLLDEQRSELLQRIGRHGEAAQLLLGHGKPALAAPVFEQAGLYGEAVDAYLAARRENDALRLVEKHGEAISAERRGEVLLSASRHLEAASIFEEIGQLDAAAMAYEAAGDRPHAAALWEKSGAHQRAAELYARAERYYDAARCYATADDNGLAAEHFILAGAPRNAADAYLNADLPVAAARRYLDAGDADSAREAIEDLPPEHPQHAEACLILVPLLLDGGEVEAAGERSQVITDAVKEGRFLDRGYEVRYCKARYLEAKGRYDAAEALYRKVMTERLDYRDTAERIDDIRSRLMADPALAAPPEELTGVTRTLEAELHFTQPIRFKPSAASTGPRQGGAGAEDGPSSEESRRAETSSAPSVVDLPVEIKERLDPWWDGADFLSVADRESGEPRLMVSFPLAVVGARASIFEQITRQLRSLRHRAILQLEGTETASDKVLLFYESFEGETLEKALGSGRSFAPRDALRLVIQLCEALTRSHKLGLTHQWLSPRTVLIDRENRCKMVGLGLREFLAGDSPTSRAYLSPEVEEGTVVGPTSDVYSLGWLAMTLLDAGMPRRRGQIDPASVRWPAEVEKEIPVSLRNFLVRCLDTDPLARPSTAEMAAALAAIGFLPGQLLGDRYEIVREIGRGGMSRVYSAVDRELGGDLAIKTVLTPALGRTEDEERLYREVQISRRITHSHVVRVHDLGRFPGGIFVIMELLDGPGLDEVIRDEAPLELGRVKRLLREIAGALGEAHRLHIVHRDLKPGNVILVDGRVKVLDFGIARAKDDSSHLTRTGEVIGSPLYMAPEQIQGQELDGRCDLYALGVITYTLLTGREPFAADSPTSVVLKHLNDPPPDIRQILPELPQAWVELLDKLLAKKPDDRYTGAAALLEAAAALPE